MFKVLFVDYFAAERRRKLFLLGLPFSFAKNTAKGENGPPAFRAKKNKKKLWEIAVGRIK
jgi:hypothetical protein